MEILRWSLFLSTILKTFKLTGAVCTFPDDLRGVWVSTHIGPIVFDISTITGYRTSISGGKDLTLNCIIRDESKYTVKASESILVFGSNVSIYICLEFNQVATDVFRYYIRTGYNALLKDNVYGDSTMTTPSVCTNGTNNEHILFKNVTASNSIVGIECPSIINGNYGNLSTSTLDNICRHGSLSCDPLSSSFILYPDTSCSNVGNITFTCLQYTETDVGNSLYVWTDDKDFYNMSPYGFFCLNITKTDDILSFSISPEVCSTESSSLLDIEFKEIKEVLQETNNIPTNKDSSLSSGVTAVIVLVVLISLVCSAVFLVHWQRKNISAKCFNKKPAEYNFDDAATR